MRMHPALPTILFILAIINLTTFFMTRSSAFMMNGGLFLIAGGVALFMQKKHEE